MEYNNSNMWKKKRNKIVTSLDLSIIHSHRPPLNSNIKVILPSTNIQLATKNTYKLIDQSNYQTVINKLVDQSNYQIQSNMTTLSPK